MLRCKEVPTLCVCYDATVFLLVRNYFLDFKESVFPDVATLVLHGEQKYAYGVRAGTTCTHATYMKLVKDIIIYDRSIISAN